MSNNIKNGNTISSSSGGSYDDKATSAVMKFLKMCTCPVLVVLLAWVIGFMHISPELVKYTNWVGEFPCDANVLRPSDVSELQAAVRAAPSVRATGSGCSFNTMACPKSYGLVVDMRSFQKMELLEESANDMPLVRVQAGVYFGQLLDFLLESGLSVSWHPGNPTYTVAGCLATGCHNMGMAHIGDATNITFITADGSFRSVTPDDPDWLAAGVSMGRLGIIYEVTLRTSLYAPHTTSGRAIPLAGAKDIIDVLEQHRDIQSSNSSQRMRLEFRIEMGELQEQVYEWGRKDAKIDIPLAEGFKHFQNPSYFRLQPSMLAGHLIKSGLEIFQRAFDFATSKLTLHTWSQMLLSGMPEKMKRRHQGRAGDQKVLWGNRHTWANVVDETVNFVLGLRHSEVVFPLEPRDKALKCMDIFYKYKHFYWFRSYIRMMPGDNYYLSTVYVPPGTNPKSSWFVRVDFVTPAKVLSRDELQFTQDLQKNCPGWRKHWGKSLWTTSAEEMWGDAAAFKDAVARWDPACKFRPVDWPAWADAPCKGR
jgi:hypothetical protein